jgi:hypothetical protein
MDNNKDTNLVQNGIYYSRKKVMVQAPEVGLLNIYVRLSHLPLQWSSMVATISLLLQTNPLPLQRSFMVATISLLLQTFSSPFTKELHGSNNFILTSDFLLSFYEGASW